MKTTLDFFPVGTTFAPVGKATEVPVGEWEKDICTMKALGLNIYRMFIAWDRIEGKRGQYDFSKPDLSFRLAEKYGIKVIVMVGGSGASFPGVYAPRWLYRDLDVTLRRKRPTPGNELQTTNFRLCYDDPVLLREMEKFVRLVVRRYQDSPALAAWAPCNEIGELVECWCPHTLAQYRDFLKRKYGTVEALSNAWSSENPMDFADWSEAFPATSAGFKEGGYQMFLDYREFQERNRDAIFNHVSDWIKSEDPRHPVVVHYAGAIFSEIGCRGDIAAASTYVYFEKSNDRYDMPAAELNREWNYASALFQLNDAPWRDDRDGFWQLESEGGPTYWVHDMMPRSLDAHRMNARDMLFVSHGARCVMRWMYRSRQTDSQAGEFNLVGWDGSVLDRSRQFGELAKVLNEHKDVFLTHMAEPYQVAMLHRDWEAYWRWQMENVDRYWKSYPRLYSALCDSGVRPKLLAGSQLTDAALSGVKLLIIPFRPWLSRQMAEAIRRFVARGGRLVAESPFAIKDMGGVHCLLTPGFGLNELFGCRIVDMDKVRDGKCGNLPCMDFEAVITPDGCTVESRFANGHPSVITNNWRDGAARLYASLVFERCTGENEPLYRRELSEIFKWAAVTPQYHLDEIGDDERQALSINPRRLPDGRKLLFVVNAGQKALSCRIAAAGDPHFRVLCAGRDSTCDQGHCAHAPSGWVVLIEDQ